MRFIRAVLTAFALASAPSAAAQGFYNHPADCWLLNKSDYKVSFTGVNPSQAEFFEEIKLLAGEFAIPVEIIGGIVQQESGGWQYGSDGFVVHNLAECRSHFNNPTQPPSGAPPGLGLMQLTGATARQYDVPSLITDWRANLRAGVDTISDKQQIHLNSITADRRALMTANSDLLENWFYAMWRYNGFSQGNTYPSRVYQRMRTPSARLTGLFTPVGLTDPELVMAGHWDNAASDFRTHTFVARRDGVWICTHNQQFTGAVHRAQPIRNHEEMLLVLNAQAAPPPLNQLDFNRDTRFDIADFVDALNFTHEPRF